MAVCKLSSAFMNPLSVPICIPSIYPSLLRPCSNFSHNELRVCPHNRFMAASKVLGEETVSGSAGQANDRGNGS
jgi:hypothetical protein